MGAIEREQWRWLALDSVHVRRGVDGLHGCEQLGDDSLLVLRMRLLNQHDLLLLLLVELDGRLV